MVAAASIYLMPRCRSAALPRNDGMTAFWGEYCNLGRRII